MKHNMQEDFAERVRVNQQKRSSGLRTRFDSIVCGAGTSGCVVAARLAADLQTHVLLLEAGGTDETDVITHPNHWPLTLGSELDWGFVAEPNPPLNGRAIPSSMGKCRGLRTIWRGLVNTGEVGLRLYRGTIKLSTPGLVHGQATCR
jgi:choline dehydrogenase